MYCSEFEEALDDLDRAGTPGLALREAALAHAEGCGRCAQLMTDTEALDFSLQKLAMRDADLQAPPRVEAALLAELRQQKAAASRRKGQWRMASLATAAAVLLTLGISLRHVLLTGAKGDGGNNAAKGSVLKAVSDAMAPGGTGSAEVAENVRLCAGCERVRVATVRDRSGNARRRNGGASGTLAVGAGFDGHAGDGWRVAGADSCGHPAERRRSAAGDPAGVVGGVSSNDQPFSGGAIRGFHAEGFHGRGSGNEKQNENSRERSPVSVRRPCSRV